MVSTGSDSDWVVAIARISYLVATAPVLTSAQRAQLTIRLLKKSW